MFGNGDRVNESRAKRSGEHLKALGGEPGGSHFIYILALFAEMVECGVIWVGVGRVFGPVFSEEEEGFRVTDLEDGPVGR